MNKPKSSGFSAPKFQTRSSDNRFSEKRSSENRFSEQGFQNHHARDEKKFSKNKPQFERTNKRNDDKPEGSRGKLSLAPKELKVTETQLGNVKVVVKSTGVSDKPKVKKTGALSPRAPEKIKKNRAEEMKVYGENACLALFAQRPEAIVRVWATVEMAHKIGEMFSYLATNKKVYHVVDRDELELVSGAEHHGGICMLVKKQRPFTLAGYLDLPRQEDCVLLLDGIRNPQNLGGIIRTCAFYGIKAVITDEPELLQSANAMRVAEGGMEYVHILQTDYADNALTQLRKAGYQIVHSTTNKQTQGIHKVRLENKVVFVLSEGSTSALAEKNDTVANLSFANPLKNNLNVAVQAGVLLAKWVGKS